jgi:precorrin-4 methylase
MRALLPQNTAVLVLGAADIRDKVKQARITRTALVLVGPALADQHAPESRLYAADHHHLLRPGRTRKELRDERDGV